MEFGITIPLQRQLKIPAPFYGSERELCYCWELHGIVASGRPGADGSQCLQLLYGGAL